MTIDPGWRRLPTAAIISFAVQGAANVARHGWQAIVPLIAALGFSNTDWNNLVTWPAFAIFSLCIAALMTYAVIAYRNFGYTTSKSEIIVRQGVFTKRQLTLPYERIQTFKTRHPIHLRPFRLVDLRLQSAGAKGDEIRLPGISHSSADDILAHIAPPHDIQNKTAITNPTDKTGNADSTLILKLSLRDLLLHGLISRQIFLLFAALTGLTGGSSKMSWTWTERLYEFIDARTQGNIIADIAIIALLIFIVLFVGLLLSTVLSVIKHYQYEIQQYEIQAQNTGFRFQYGLLERHERQLKQAKIQCLRIRQSLTARLLKRKTLRIVQAGEGDKQSAATIVPILDEDQSRAVMAAFLPEFDPAALIWRPVLRSYAFHLLALSFIPTLALTVTTVASGNRFGLAFLLIPFLCWPFCLRAYKKRQYAFGPEYGASQGGLFRHWTYVFPIHKAQSVSLTQNPLQQRRGTATLNIALAGARVRISPLKLKDAQHWRDFILYKVESSHRSWM